MPGKKNILICPLEWGLGHAARMIPVARRLIEMKHNVFIASGDEHLLLFTEELPGLTCIHFPGFKPKYSGFFPQYIALLLQTPLLIFFFFFEHIRLRKIITDYCIDIVISDNRFGLWNRNLRTAYVTHMPLIPFPKPLQSLEFIGIFLHRIIIRKYSYLFIPDLPGENNLTGRLSHNIRLPETARYIGILSRFPVRPETIPGNRPDYKYYTVILSGPEPQRSIFRQKILDIFDHEKLSTLILEGKPGKKEEVVRSDNFIFYNHLTSSEMQQMICGSEKIITRAGYSTIMELVSLGCTALLVPTPGQTEQEYLAEYLSSRGWFSTCSQKSFKRFFVTPNKIETDSKEINSESYRLLDEALMELSE